METTGGNTDRESARESTSVEGGAGLGVEVTLTDTVLHEDVTCAYFVLIWWKHVVKITFTEQEVTAIHAKLEAIRERVNKLIMTREIAALHKLDEMQHLRLLKKLAA